VHVERSASYALGNAEGASDALGGEPLGLPRLGLALAVPGRAYTGERALPAAFRLHGGDQLVPWWVRRPAGWAGELTFTEVSGRRVRAVLHPTDPGAGEAWRVDARGEQLDRLPATPEGDGYEIEAAPHEVLIVRWK
jgi:hypothetical protein